MLLSKAAYKKRIDTQAAAQFKLAKGAYWLT